MLSNYSHSPASGDLLTKSHLNLSHLLSGISGSLQVDRCNSRSIDDRFDIAPVDSAMLFHIEAGKHSISLSRKVSEKNQKRQKYIIITLAVCGASILEQNGQHIDIAPQYCVIYDADTPLLLSHTMPINHFSILCPAELAARYGLQIYGNSSPQYYFMEGRSASISQGLIELAIYESNNISSERAKLLLDLIFRSLALFAPTSISSRLKTPHKRLVEKACDYINTNLGDPSLDITQIAGALGCSKRYLHKSFTETGVTLSKYIWTTRLQKCRQELINFDAQEKSITDIAFSWGFNSSSHFSRSFRKQFGISPSYLIKHK